MHMMASCHTESIYKIHIWVPLIQAQLKKEFLEEFSSQIIMYITYIQQSLWQKKLLLFLEIVYWSTL